MENGNKPAFSVALRDNGNARHPEAMGLNKREYFAALAMQGLLTRVPQRQGGEVDLGILECERIAAESRIMADKLLKELEKQQ